MVFVTPTCNRIQTSSYEEDPKYQIKLTIAWCSFLAAGVLVSFPRVYKAYRNGKVFTGFFGIKDDWIVNYTPVSRTPSAADIVPPRLKTRGERLCGILLAISSIFLWAPPGVGLNLGQS